MNNRISIAFLVVFLMITSIVVGQACYPSILATADPDFLAECPWCIPSAPFQVGSGTVPCYLSPVGGWEVSQVNFRYVLIFDDEFAGDAIDLSKWVTANQAPYGLRAAVNSYDNGINFQFDHPGVEILDKYQPGYITYNSQTYDYTTSQLQSQYQFPLFRNTTYSLRSGDYTIYPYMYGIYQLNTILPEAQAYNGGPSPQPPYGGSAYSNPAINGYIWPAFWMWGYNENANIYGEIDGFEFTYDASDDAQTSHYPSLNYGSNCASVYSGSYFGDGSPHNFYSMYTPDEIDWWVDITNTRLDTKYYGEDDPLIGSNTFYPICEPPVTGDADDDNYENCVFPQNVPMWLMLGNAVQNGAQSQYFPVNWKIKSVQYWVPGNCDNTTDVTKTDIHNYNTLQFNAYTGTTVTIDGITNGAIDSFDIPSRRIITSSHDESPGGFTHGNLEAIAINKVQIIGKFQSAGYLVLKTDANMCNEYTGPYPFDDVKSSRRPVKRERALIV